MTELGKGFGQFKLGDKLWHKKEGDVYYVEIVETDEGPRARMFDVRQTDKQIEKFADNKHKLVERAPGENVDFSGLSKAAGSLIGFMPAINSFWHTGDPSEKKARAPRAEKAPKAEKAAPTPKAKKGRAKPGTKTENGEVKLFRVMPEKEGCPEGMTYWYCLACADGFCLPQGEDPTVCLQNHTQEMAAELLGKPAGETASTEPEGAKEPEGQPAAT